MYHAGPLLLLVCMTFLLQPPPPLPPTLLQSSSLSPEQAVNPVNFQYGPQRIDPCPWRDDAGGGDVRKGLFSVRMKPGRGWSCCACCRSISPCCCCCCRCKVYCCGVSCHCGRYSKLTRAVEALLGKGAATRSGVDRLDSHGGCDQSAKVCCSAWM